MKSFTFLLVLLASSTTHAQPNLARSNNDFAFRIYKNTKPDADNFFISPFSLTIAMAIANEGASGSTRLAIDNLLGLKGVSNREVLYRKLIEQTINVNDANFKDCIANSRDKQGKNIISIANSLWVNDAISINPAFRRTAIESYKSEIFGFNAVNIDATNKKMNEWISAKTNNKIGSLPPLQKEVPLSIVNAIYFAGQWEMPFDPAATKKEKFSALDRNRVDVKMMHIQSHYNYYEDDDVQSISIPYKCNQFSMIVVLPKNEYGLVNVEKKLSAVWFDKIRPVTDEDVVLSFPKFKIESQIEPRPVIENMGYREIFSDNADFKKMADANMKIDRIIHKTFIETDEKKTEAAAVTRIDMAISGSAQSRELPPPPRIFNADHAFMFVIVDNRTGVILFVGRFVG